jgi:hypothetical protein
MTTIPLRGLPVRPAAAHPPPFALPAAHFVAALLWLGVGAIGLVVVAPALARGQFLDPRVLATVHAFSLGVVTTSIFGSLYQMLPPLMGVTVRSVRAAAIGFVLLNAGVVTLVTALWLAHPAWQGVAWTLVAGAIGCASWTLLPQRRKATQGRLTGLYISAGHSALGLAFLMAGARIGEGLGWWQLDRLGMLAAHFHLAALGFATLTAVGVSSRIVPMFLACERAPVWPLRWIGPVAGAGLLLFAGGQVGHVRPATLAGAALLALAMAGYLGLVTVYFRTRTQPIDPALGHIAAAFVGLAAAVVAGLALLWTSGGAFQRGLAAYAVLALLGWLITLIAGVYYRVIPFLTWLNLGGAAAARRDPGGLMPRRTAWVTLAMLSGGTWTLAAAVAAGQPGMARAAAGIFAVAVGGLLSQYVRLVMVIRRSRQPEAAGGVSRGAQLTA